MADLAAFTAAMKAGDRPVLPDMETPGENAVRYRANPRSIGV